jgi:hypothetical protein
MAAIEISCPDGPSETGAYRLSWSGPEGATFRLVETSLSASSPAERVLYEGNDDASTVSGRPEGLYRYKVGIVEVRAWSESCTLRVEPPSMHLAITLFGIGFAVVAATVLTILFGHRAHRRGEIG